MNQRQRKRKGHYYFNLVKELSSYDVNGNHTDYDIDKLWKDSIKNKEDEYQNEDELDDEENIESQDKDIQNFKIRTYLNKKYNGKYPREDKLYKLVSKILKDKNINSTIERSKKITEGRLLSLDIYFEYNGKKIGIEYQGQQHFEPVELFGGDIKFIKQKEWDKEKQKICKDSNIELVYFTYQEELSEYLVINKLSDIIGEF